MDMIQSIFQSFSNTATSLGDIAVGKIAIAGVLAFLIGSQGTALAAFVALILLDLVTKWMSLTYKCLIDQGTCQEDAGLWQCIRNMPLALKLRYITSTMMKTRFIGKIILYMFLVIAAVKVDEMAGGGEVFLKAAWYYLAATEGVSIIENLRDAGVSNLDPLLTFIRSKLGGLK